jgi:hypothetical protein
MNSFFDLSRNFRIGLGCIGELLGYLLRFASVFLRSRTSLAARLSAGHVQAEDRSEAASHKPQAFGSGGTRPPSLLQLRTLIAFAKNSFRLLVFKSP